MSADDPHAPTPAGPDQAEKTEVDPAANPFAEPTAKVEPTPVVAPSGASEGTPAGAARPATHTPDPVEQAPAVTDKPEVQVGLAFLGGAAVSLILKRFGR